MENGDKPDNHQQINGTKNEAEINKYYFYLQRIIEVQILL